MVPNAKRGHGQFFATLRFSLAVTLFLLGLLTVVHVPHQILWVPSIFVSEWGHFAAIGPLLLLFGKWNLLRSRLAFFFALGAFALFLSPLVRAVYGQQDVSNAVQKSFGKKVPHLFVDAVSRSNVVVASDFFKISGPKVKPEIHNFKPGLTLDLYRRNNPRNQLPIIVVVHGGKWQFGDSKQIPAVNHYLARRGYAVAAINYRKGPENPFPAARDDVVAAIGYLKAHSTQLSLDPDRIVLLGRSAGGQLALVVAYGVHDPAIRGVVGLYAPTDMIYSWNNPGNPWVINGHKLLRDYLGGTPNEKSEAYHQASAMRLVLASAPPTLLFHGGRDELVWLHQSQRLSQRLTELNVKHLLVTLDWADHGFDANLWGPSGQIYLYVLERFLGSVLR